MGLYALMGAPSNDVSSAYAYPVPFVASKHTQIHFTNLPDGGEIKIYSVNGQCVKTLRIDAANAGILHWDTRNDGGEPVGSDDRIREVAASIDRDSDGNFIRGGSSDGAQLGVVIDVEEWSATNQIDDEGLSFLVPVYNDTDALILGLTFLLMRNGAKSEEISDIVDRIIA
jgi:hypothetical protein